MRTQKIVLCLTLATGMMTAIPAFADLSRLVSISGKGHIEMVYPNLYSFTLDNPQYSIVYNKYQVKNGASSEEAKAALTPALIAQYTFIVDCFSHKGATDAITMVGEPQITNNHITFKMVPVSNPSPLMKANLVNGTSCTLQGVIFNH